MTITKIHSENLIQIKFQNQEEKCKNQKKIREIKEIEILKNKIIIQKIEEKTNRKIIIIIEDKCKKIKKNQEYDNRQNMI